MLALHSRIIPAFEAHTRRGQVISSHGRKFSVSENLGERVDPLVRVFLRIRRNAVWVPEAFNGNAESRTLIPAGEGGSQMGFVTNARKHYVLVLSIRSIEHLKRPQIPVIRMLLVVEFRVRVETRIPWSLRSCIFPWLLELLANRWTSRRWIS